MTLASRGFLGCFISATVHVN